MRYLITSTPLQIKITWINSSRQRRQQGMIDEVFQWEATPWDKNSSEQTDRFMEWSLAQLGKKKNNCEKRRHNIIGTLRIFYTSDTTTINICMTLVNELKQFLNVSSEWELVTLKYFWFGRNMTLLCICGAKAVAPLALWRHCDRNKFVFDSVDFQLKLKHSWFIV